MLNDAGTACEAIAFALC